MLSFAGDMTPTQDAARVLAAHELFCVMQCMPASSCLVARQVARSWAEQVPPMPCIRLNLHWSDLHFADCPTRELPHALRTEVAIRLPPTGFHETLRIMQHLAAASPWVKPAQVLEFSAPREVQLAALGVIVGYGAPAMFSDVKITADCFRSPPALAEEKHVVALLSLLPSLQSLWLQRSSMHFGEFGQLTRLTTLRLDGILPDGGVLELPSLQQLALSFNMESPTSAAAVTSALSGALPSLTKLEMHPNLWGSDADDHADADGREVAWNTVLQQVASHLPALRALVFDSHTCFRATPATYKALASLSGLTQLRCYTMCLPKTEDVAPMILPALQDLQVCDLSDDVQLVRMTPSLTRLMSREFAQNSYLHMMLQRVPSNIKALEIPYMVCDAAWFASLTRLEDLTCTARLPADVDLSGLSEVVRAAFTIHADTPGKLDGLVSMHKLRDLEFVACDLASISAEPRGVPQLRLPGIHTLRLDHCTGISAGVVEFILDCMPGLASVELCACVGLTGAECHDAVFHHPGSLANVSYKSAACCMLGPFERVLIDEEWDL